MLVGGHQLLPAHYLGADCGGCVRLVLPHGVVHGEEILVSLPAFVSAVCCCMSIGISIHFSMAGVLSVGLERSLVWEAAMLAKTSKERIKLLLAADDIVRAVEIEQLEVWA